MVMLTAANAIASSPLLPAGSVGQQGGRAGVYGSGPRRVCVDRSVVRSDIRPAGLGTRLSLERRKPLSPITGSRRTQSASVICASSLNARCGAEQTQTVTREAPTITHLPGKEKSPLLDDGGTGFPPRDDGGFAFFGFLLFLSFLKDKESEGSYRENRKRSSY
ncbi:hypothetical protein ABKV19_002919 [Rosa sericea]